MTHLPSTGDAAHDAWLERRALSLPDARQWQLTPREADVLDCVCETGYVKVAAERLGLAHATVDFHLRKIRRRNAGLVGASLFAAWAAYRVSTAPTNPPGSSSPGEGAALPGA